MKSWPSYLRRFVIVILCIAVFLFVWLFALHPRIFEAVHDNNSWKRQEARITFAMQEARQSEPLGSPFDSIITRRAPLLTDNLKASEMSMKRIYELELKAILSKAKGETSHELVITNTTMGCSARNFPPVFSKCFKNGTVRCGKRYLPQDPKERILDFLNNENLRIAAQYKEALKFMGAKVNGQYDLIIVSALSSNHFSESQAMLQQLHQKIFPLLSNYLLVVYDLGLSPQEHLEYQEHCQCVVLQFPFHLFPPFFKNLKCFGWKPAVLRAHFDNAKLVMWMDASVRYHDPQGFLRAMELAQTYGVQQHRSEIFVPNPLRAIPSAFLFFGDSPCAHVPFTQAESNWGIYRTTPLIKDMFMDSWVACGLNKKCTCPAYPNLMLDCTNKNKFGQCMRPQFAVGAVLAKLYMEHYNLVVNKGADFMNISRGT